MGDILHQETPGTVARDDGLAGAAASERPIEIIEAQSAFRTVSPVAGGTGLVEYRFNVGGVSHTFLVGCRREFPGRRRRCWRCWRWRRWWGVCAE